MALPSWGDSLAAIGRRQTYDTQVGAATLNANPAMAPAVVAHTNAAPWSSPQTGYVLASAGAQPGDPVSQAVSQATLNKKGGGFWGSLGHIVSAPVRAVTHLAGGLEALGGDLQGAGKIAARTAFTGLNSLYEVPMGAVRDVAAAGGDVLGGIATGAATGAAVGLAGGPLAPISVLAGTVGGAVVGGIGGAMAQAKGVDVKGQFVNPLEQSAGTMAVGKLLSGNKIDLGTGFQPGGALSAEATKNMQTAASINGHALTPGRMLASSVFTPGSTGYNLLSGTADAITRWELDPGRYVGEEVGAQRQAARELPGVTRALDESGKALEKAGPITKLLNRTGVLDAADPNFNPEVARNFLTSDPAARNFVSKAAETNSAWDIVKASNGKISSQLANDLASNNTEQGVLDTLLNHMENQGLREKAAVQTGGSWLGQTVSNIRPVAKMAPVFDRLSSVMPQHSVSLLDVDRAGGGAKLDNAVQQLNNVFTQARMPEAVKTPILNELMQTTTADEAQSVIQQAVHGTVRDHLVAMGAPEAAINNVLHTTLEDQKALMSLTHGEVGNAAPIKQLTLGEEQFPLPQAADVLGDQATQARLPDGRTLRQMTTPSERMRAIYNSKAFQETSHGADFLMGKWKNLNIPRPALVTKFLGMAMSKMAANGLETPLSDIPTQIAMALNKATRPGELEGLIEGSAHSQASEVMALSKKMAGGLSAEELAPYQMTLTPKDPGFARSWAARAAEQHVEPVAQSIATNGVEATVQSMLDGVLNEHRIGLVNEGDTSLGNMEGVRAHVQTAADNLEAITAANPQLLDAIGTGNFLGVDLLKSHPGGLINPDFEAALQQIVDGQEIEVPNMMKAAKPHQVDPDYGHKVGRLTNALYSTLGKAQDALVNHPAFNQLYWQGVAENVPNLSEEGRAALAERMGADNVRISKGTAGSIGATLDKSNLGALSAGDVHELAKASAIQKLQDMTIDMSKKQGWQDTMRHIAPFAKHWQQETSQWARILSTHPEAFEKANMVVQGAKGSGFFHKDKYGALVFNYPGSGLVSKVLTGVDMPLTGKVSGLSAMTTDIMPGAGPMVSLAASKLIPNKPEFDDIRNFLSPYGDPTAQGALAAVLPPWAKTLQTALSDPQNDRDAANTTMQVARWLVSTGKYNMNTPEDVTKTLDAAGSRARSVLMLQAMGKFVLPSTPSLQPMVQDKDGRTVVAKLLSDDLIQMRKDDYENSTQNFLDKYGDNALLFLQSATRPLAAGAAGTKEQDDWSRANPELAKAFPNSYAFFAPQGAQTPDFNTITRQLHTGERQALTPKQQVALANNQVGNMIFYNVKAKMGTHITAPAQEWLNGLRQQLMQQYPGFGVPVTGVGARATDSAQSVQNTIIPEMQKALDNPKMANTDTGKALAQYMGVRAKVDAAAQAGGLKPGAFAQAAHAENLRALLNNVATQLSQNNTGFSMLFSELLSRELKTDTQPGATPPNAPV